MKYNKEIVELLGFEESEVEDLKNVICLSQFVINELWLISDKNENYKKLYPIFSKLLSKIFDIPQIPGEVFMDQVDCKKLYLDVFYPALDQITKRMINVLFNDKNLPELLSKFLIDSSIKDHFK